MVADVQLYEGRSLDIVTQAESLGSYGAADRRRLRQLHGGERHGRDGRPADRGRGVAAAVPAARRRAALARRAREHGAALTLDSYLLRALSLAGWAPSFLDCARCGAPGPALRVRRAARRRGLRRLRPAGRPAARRRRRSALLGALLTGDWDAADATPTTRPGRQASGVVAAYTQWHLERGLRSLQHVRPRAERSSRRRE